MVEEVTVLPSAGPRTRVVTLDASRGLAAWLVLLSHVGFWTGATASGVVGGLTARGDAGVAVFFALSALLLSSPFVRRGLGGRATWTARDYAARRAARILPAYYVALAAVVVAALVLGSRAGSLPSAADLLVHLVVGQGVTCATFVSFTQTWSLTSELTFYVLLPVVAPALAPWVRGGVDPVARGRRMLAVCGALAAGGLLLQGLAAVATGPGAPWWAGALATSAPGHALWFATGIALAVVLEAEAAGITLVRGPAAATLEALRTSPGTLLLAAGVLWLVAATPLVGPRDLADPSVAAAVLKEIVYGLAASTLLLAATSRGLPEAVGASRWAGPARWLGDTSYAVFLWHVLVLQVSFAVLDLQLFAAPFVPVLVLVTVVSLGLAHLSWVLVERPAIARAHRRRDAAEPRPAARA